MVERVALAIDEHTKQNKITSSVALARVAIEAMKEPTEEMKSIFNGDPWIEIRAYKAMIDAALK